MVELTKTNLYTAYNLLLEQTCFRDSQFIDKFNVNIYPNAGKYAVFTGNNSMPENPFFIGFFGSAWDVEEGGSTNKGVGEDTFNRLERMADTLVKINDHYGNIVIMDGACPESSLPSLMTRIIKEKSRSSDHKEVYAMGIHPGNDKQIMGSVDDLYGNRDLIIFTDYLNAWNGNYSSAFRDRDSRNCDFADAGILMNGGIGTADEAMGLAQKGKIIATLAGTGGIADALPGFLNNMYNNYKVLSIHESDPKKLMKRVIGQIHLDRILSTNYDFTVFDVRNDKAYIWEPAKLEEHDLYQRQFAFNPPEEVIQRSIIPSTLDGIIGLIEIDKITFRENMPHILIKRMATVEGNNLSSQLEFIRKSKGPTIVWHHTKAA